ncbi:hypothetical protein [Thiomicrorhabdus aquaedulcis]|uniref:hypothetical protein n=1 Tax=Thiomicrorhabdus aquaedulcis TaxID=2211106 RepID=UPI000FDA3EF2|nr:hypothetical protein [Thiomicrorhabdus aquaedulcis]
MYFKTISRVHILYEMAMVIGNTLDLNELLKDSLKVILRKLDGVMIAVVDPQHNALLAIPRRGLTPEYQQNLQRLTADFLLKKAPSKN